MRVPQASEAGPPILLRRHVLVQDPALLLVLEEVDLAEHFKDSPGLGGPPVLRGRHVLAFEMTLSERLAFQMLPWLSKHMLVGLWWLEWMPGRIAANYVMTSRP